MRVHLQAWIISVLLKVVYVFSTILIDLHLVLDSQVSLTVQILAELKARLSILWLFQGFSCSRSDLFPKKCDITSPSSFLAQCCCSCRHLLVFFGTKLDRWIYFFWKSRVLVEQSRAHFLCLACWIVT